MLDMAIEILVRSAKCPLLMELRKDKPCKVHKKCDKIYPSDKKVCHECWTEYLKWDCDTYGS